MLVSLIGQGYSGTITPPVIQRNVLEDPAWYTAYTPYQPEISQGRLEALLNFQTMVSDLTAMDLANASLLDEATAAAEAMTMLRRVNPKAGDTFFVDAECHPQTIDVVRTRAEPLGIDVVVGVPRARSAAPRACSGCCCSTRAPPAGSATTASWWRTCTRRARWWRSPSDLLALVLLAPPGEWGADVVVGSAQRFGVPMGYGGPHAAFFATREEYKRNLPGRLVGVSVDAAGRPALRLALQTREQHIRREKATSNICTAQVLLANIAGMYAVYHGPDGLRAIAERVHDLTADARRSPRDLLRAGARHVLRHDRGARARRGRRVIARARAVGLNLRRVDATPSASRSTRPRPPRSSVACDEVFGGRPTATPPSASPTRCDARSDILVHPVFRTYHSESQMLRYLRTLADRDLALDRTMIPLGSCTMKLNATTEMMPITWPEFAEHAPVRARRPGRGLRRAVRRARGRALRDHRLRRGVAAAQRGLAGRARRPARDPRLPREPGPGRAHGVPDPGVRARHQRGERGDGGHARRGREVRRRRQRRLRRPQGQGPRARRRPRAR